MSFIILACPFCGIGSGTVIFLLLLSSFVLMFLGTITVFLGSWKQGHWKDQKARWSALEAEFQEEKEK